MDELHIGKSKYKLVRTVNERFTKDIGGHRHGAQSYEIHYCINGSGELTTEEGVYPLSPNILYITGPDTWHRQSVGAKGLLCELCIYIQVVSKGNDELSCTFNMTRFWIGEAGAQLQHFFDILSQFVNKDSLYSKELQLHLTELIITEITNLYSRSSVLPDKATPDDKKFIIIEEAFLYKYNGITVESLAQSIGLSVRQTQRILKQFYGLTFREKCIRSRLEAAYIMLKKGKSVKLVAREVGYGDSPSFIRAFKKLYGKTPSEIIKENIKE